LEVASPSSSANLDWFARAMAPDLVAESVASGRGAFGFLDGLLAALAPMSETSPYYIPFLFGSPLEIDASAGLAGLRAWHTRADAIRAVLEGIALNHRHHIDRLPLADDAVPRLIGGVSRNGIWVQLMADLLGREVEIAAAPEPGALGAAAAAFVAGGVFDDLPEAVAAMVRPGRKVAPGAGVGLAEARYARYRDLLDALTPWWSSD
jgi:L-xylulokinase